MSEILLFSSDHGAAKAGDVQFAMEDGHSWGECECGGPHYTAQITQIFREDCTFQVAPGFSLVGITAPYLIPPDKIVSQTRADPVEDTGGSTPNGWGPVAITGNNTLTASFYTARVTGQKISPISDHEEGNHPFWRIWKLPNVSLVTARALASPYMPDNQPTATYIPPAPANFRARCIDFSKITDPALIAYMADDTRAAGFFTSIMSESDFDALISQRV